MRDVVEGGLLCRATLWARWVNSGSGARFRNIRTWYIFGALMFVFLCMTLIWNVIFFVSVI